MSKTSNPCWAETLDRQGVPDWRGMAAPEVVAFLYTGECQVRKIYYRHGHVLMSF